MKKKFLVQIVFIFEETSEIYTEDWLQYFIRENGGVYFSGDERDAENNSITHIHYSGKEVILNVAELED
ncbi:hypothetical protein LCGC14_2175080 [marine sediment metagenome]|uniref:Uncharacterized protein n=1 Tax=marine sediment metagenome TaxID=412755 RepID=A0A0F9G1L9_9ZZZZ